MNYTDEDVKSMIRARIDDKREQEAYEASQSARKQGGDELRALRHWSDIHLHNQVLRRLLNDIDAKSGPAHLQAERDAPAEMPTGLLNAAQHADDIAVDRFAQAMKAKLAAGRAKGRAGWSNPGDPTDAQLAASLVKHLTKGNAGTFVDVANFCMFLHQRGASPSVLQHAAFYTPASNFQRNTLLIAIQKVREALQFASDSPTGPIRDTIWMMHRPETLLDFIDGTLKGLFPESTATAFVGARNMLYAGLFEDETEDERDARLALAHAMTQAAKGST